MKKYEKPLFIEDSINIEEIILSSGLNVEDIHDIGGNIDLDDIF